MSIVDRVLMPTAPPLSLHPSFDPMTMSLLLGASGLMSAGGSVFTGLLGGGAEKAAAAAQSDAAFQARNNLLGSQTNALSMLLPFLAPGMAAGGTLSNLLVSPEERARQVELQRSGLQSKIDELKMFDDIEAGKGYLFTRYPVLTGKNASERRASLISEEAFKKQGELRAAQAALAKFDQEAKINAQYDERLRTLATQGGGGIEASPLYKFQLDEGTKAINQQLSSRGLASSGIGLETLSKFVRGLGAEETERQVGRLFKMFDSGQQAATTGAGLLSSFASPIAGTYVQQGNANAQGIRGSAAFTTQGITGAMNALTSTAGGLMNQSLFQGLAANNRAGALPAEPYYGRTSTFNPGGGDPFVVNVPGF